MAKQTPDQISLELKALRTEAKRAKNSIVTQENTAFKKVNSIDKLIQSTRKQISNVTSDFKTRINKEAKEVKAEAEVSFEEISNLQRNARKEYKKLASDFAKAENTKTGVVARYQAVINLAQTAEQSVKDITKKQARVTESADKIKQLLNTSRSNKSSIATIKDEAEKVREEIENTYAITLDTTMAGTLVSRRNELKKRTRMWEIAYLSSITIIVCAIFVALLISKPNTFTEVLTERLVFVTPLFLVSFVLSKQFRHERKLYEEYAFKAASAQSLRGYTLLLNREFKDIEEARLDILEFTIGAMEGIYDREPLIENQSNFHLMFGNNLAKIEAKLEDKAREIATDAAKKAVRAKKVATDTVVDETQVSV